MTSSGFSDYNRDQRLSIQAIREAFGKLTSSRVQHLRESIQPYLHFRQAIEDYQRTYFGALCRKICFETQVSACCGFESIITFFADQVINFLVTPPEEIAALSAVLERPNTTKKCVYLGKNGCIWRVRPISCAMFLCESVKKTVFEQQPEVESLWNDFQKQEKEFNWPTKPVLFDQLEKEFMKLGVDSPHLYFHRSPGLLRIKAQARLREDQEKG